MMPFNSFIKRLLRHASKGISQISRLWQGMAFRQGAVIAGRYVIRQKLGIGSYGIAYLCSDSTADRLCVLKLVSPVRGGKKRAELIYARETGMLQCLRHPAIPKLYERFRYRNHLCFTMEYMEGTTLDSLLFQTHTAFSEVESLQLLQKLLPVVQHIHSLGIVHRDISISNVLLDGGSVKLIDLGLARELHPAAAEALDAMDIETDDPSEKVLRRKIHRTSDFYALGHLLLFLLYSTYPDNEAGGADDLGWERELTLHPDTKKLLRRLLLTEQPFENAQQILDETDRIIIGLNKSG